MNPFESKPIPFFDGNLVVHDLSSRPKFTGLNAGYETGEWRYDSFSEYLFDWLTEFALKYSDLTQINHASAMRFIKKAANAVYNTDKYKNRGEFGELFLHAIIRELFNSQPVISKLYYKSATNDTVKGFDAVHIIECGDELELWLGEVKFYKSITVAISDVITELEKHSRRDYLREEFSMITTKIDDNWKHAGKIKALLDSRTSLDTVFKCLCIPVLLTYESPIIKQFNTTSETFLNALRVELLKHYSEFCTKLSSLKLNIHLFLMPIDDKERLVKTLHQKLEGLQR